MSRAVRRAGLGRADVKFFYSPVACDRPLQFELAANARNQHQENPVKVTHMLLHAGMEFLKIIRSDRDLSLRSGLDGSL